jgi:hypothetical protein
MIYHQAAEYEYVYDRRLSPLPAFRRLPAVEPTYTFEPGDFTWTAGDIELWFKLWFYHLILYGTSDIEGKPLPASFVRFVRSKCSTPPLTTDQHGVE